MHETVCVLLLLLLCCSYCCCCCSCLAAAVKLNATQLAKELLLSCSHDLYCTLSLRCNPLLLSRSHCVGLFQGQPKSRQCFCHRHCTSSLHNIKLIRLVLENRNKIEKKWGKIEINTADYGKYLTQF